MTIIIRQIHKWHLMHDKFCLILPGRWIRKHIVRYSAVSLQSASAWLMVTAAGRGTAGAAASPDNEAHNTNLPDKVRDGELFWAEPGWAMVSYAEQGDKGDFTHQPQCPQLPCLCNYAGHTAITTILQTICKMMFRLQWLICISVLKL